MLSKHRYHVPLISASDRAQNNVSFFVVPPTVGSKYVELCYNPEKPVDKVHSALSFRKILES